MTYYQITSEERYTIAALRREGFCSAEIARRLGRHRSTISREVTRNSSRSDGCYRPSKAIERTNGRRARSRRNQYFTKADFALVEKQLKADWSPEQISGHLRLHGKLSISHETIYTHVWRDKEAGGHLYRHLRCSPKLRRKRHNSYDSRGRLAGDFAARHKVGGTHLNFFIYQQLPILPPAFYTEPRLAFLVPKILELTYTSHALAPFARDLQEPESRPTSDGEGHP